MGPPGTNGTNGNSGASALSYLTAQLVWPAEGANVDATVDSNVWLAPGDVVYVQSGGWTQVMALVGTTTVTLQNLKNTASSLYLANVAPGTVLPVASKIVAAGLQGPAGTNGTSGAATNLHYVTTQLDAALTNSFNLGGLASGLLKQTVAAGAATPAIAADGTDYLSAATGLKPAAIGTTIEAWSARLDALAALVYAADTLPYCTGVGTMALTSLTSYARTILAAANAAAARTLLGVLPRYGLLGSLTAADFNVVTDQAITMSSTKYRITDIVVKGASVNMTTAQGGVYNAVGKPGGGVLVAAGQVYTALSAATKFVALTLAGVALTDVQTAGFVYLSLSTPQGVAATADVYVFGEDLS